jgi:hypothetical protein
MSFFFNKELNVDGTTINSGEISVIDQITAGTATASKALVVDGNKDIASIRNVNLDGSFKMNYISTNQLEIKNDSSQTIIETKPYYTNTTDTDSGGETSTSLKIQASNRGSSSYSGGNIEVISGRGGTDSFGGSGGSLTLRSGNGGNTTSGTSGNGGDIYITSGTGGTYTSSGTNGDGGSMSISGGSGNTGGSISITAGSSTETGPGVDGANITLTAGSTTSSTGTNGSIILQTGNNSSSSQGNVSIKGNGDSFTTPPELRFYDADDSTYISLNSNIDGDSLSVSSSLSATSLTTGNMTVSTTSISNTSGSISFNSGNLTSIGSISASSLTTTGTISGLSLSTGSMSVSSTSITNSSGSISFDDENLSTTGTINNLHIKANGTNYGQSILISGDSITEPTISSQYNVGIGYKNLEVINGASYNVGIGYQNLKAATTGGFNTTLGFENLLSLQTASYNNSIGFKNLADLTSGDDNIGIGRYAHRYLTTGSNNVTIGKEAGFNLLNGSDNVFLGRRTGYNLASSSASDNNIFIGYLAGSNLTTSVSTNTIVIGSNAISKGNNKVVIGDGDITEVWLSDDQGATAYASHFNSGSDQRIKTNILDYSTSQALQKVNDIGIKEYNYIDTRRKGTESTPGFIAQDVETHLPIAVKETSNFIPNEYRLLTDYSLVETTDFINGIDNSDGYYWKLTINDLTDLSTTGKYKVLLSDDTTFDLNSSNNKSKSIKNIDGENTSFLLDKNWSQVFLVGKEITDFKTLEKSKIFILHHGAIQELNSLLEAERAKVATLQTEVEEIKAHLGI